MERGNGCRFEITESVAGSLQVVGRRLGIQDCLFEMLPESDLHLPRGLLGKCDRADPGKRHRRSVRSAFQHEMQNPVQERARFAGAG